MYGKTLFVFRRDLRLQDNVGLFYALSRSKTVIPCFFYDDLILKKFKNSEFRLNFLNESLFDLNLQLKKKNSSLQIFHGEPQNEIKTIIENQNIEAIFFNTDFSNYSQKRDEKINSVCKKNNVELFSSLDFLLHNPNDIKTNDGNPYTIYSHFFKKARQFPIRKLLKNPMDNFSKKNISDESIHDVTIDDPVIPGGTKFGLKILQDMKNFIDYKKHRDYPSIDNTTKLSAHNKFGTVSIRQVYYSILDNLGMDHTLMGEIYWREFFSHILYHFPWAQNKSFKLKFQKIPWSKSKTDFERWTTGMTGFPIVDAGMRELNETGFMHNRVRMIVASFLTKDLHIDWRWGEKYFAEKLVDYDPAVNSGNWQWAASTGCDSVPYFRIFNPWLQQQKFDSDCEYIKKWIPELRDLSPKLIHNLLDTFPSNIQYPKPMIIHKIESQKTKDIFKSQK